MVVSEEVISWLLVSDENYTAVPGEGDEAENDVNHTLAINEIDHYELVEIADTGNGEIFFMIKRDDFHHYKA